jgi:hypothetical protein
VAEGAPAELNKFLEAVTRRLGEHIRDVAVDVRPGSGEFSEFEIRH